AGTAEISTLSLRDALPRSGNPATGWALSTGRAIGLLLHVAAASNGCNSSTEPGPVDPPRTMASQPSGVGGPGVGFIPSARRVPMEAGPMGIPEGWLAIV